MTEVKFYLKSTKPDKEGKIPLIAQIALNYSKIRKQLGKIRLKDWNFEKQRLRLPSNSDKRYQEYALFNSLLDSIQNKVRELTNRSIIEGKKLTSDEVKTLFFNENPEKKEFYEAFDDFIEKNRNIRAKRTIQGYTTTYNFLKDFETKTKYYITWNSLNLLFVDMLINYAYGVCKKETSYLSKTGRVINTFTAWAKKRGFPVINNIRKELTIKEPEKGVIALELEELLILYYYDFNKDRLNKTRDLFCFSCFTGLRYSDVISLRREHIKNNSILKTQQKTDQEKGIQLNDFALEILDKYKEKDYLLPKLSDQKLNKYIKECCKIIAAEQNLNEGFNKNIIKKKVFGSKIEEETIPLFEAITFHVGRKTFFTNSLMLGFSIKALQEMGAPKKQKDLDKYIRLSQSFVQSQVDNTWNKIYKNQKL